jgi:hypothetical protein
MEGRTNHSHPFNQQFRLPTKAIGRIRVWIYYERKNIARYLRSHFYLMNPSEKVTNPKGYKSQLYSTLL